MNYETVFSLLRTAFALIAVLLLAYVILRLTKRVTSGASPYVSIVEKTPLSNQAYLAVAKVGDAYHLISVSGGSVQLLRDLPKEEVDAVMEQKQKLHEALTMSRLMEHSSLKHVKDAATRWKLAPGWNVLGKRKIRE